MWYKLAQEVLKHYTDIGHYSPWDLSEEAKKEKVVLWVANISGENFETQEIEPHAGGHRDFWEVSAKVYKGRYDPFTNNVSLQMPWLSRKMSLTSKDIPNRLIDRLMSEFPGASIYASEDTMKGQSMVQII